MADFIRETRAIELMSDEQIRQGIQERLQGLDSQPESMLLTWRREQMEYLLEIVIEGTTQQLTVGRIGVFEYDALNRLAIAGRRLYFRLRKEFPTLQRKLSRYQYQTLR